MAEDSKKDDKKFEIIDASGQDLPPEFMEMITEALIESGAVRRLEDGSLESTGKLPEGEIVGMRINVDDEDGTITTEDLEDWEVPTSLSSLKNIN